MTKHEILIEALALEPRERDEVAQALWQCAVAGELTADQTAEIHRRIAALDNKQDRTIPGEQVTQELRERLQS